MAHARHHARTISRSDEEWEAMREPFRKCYIDQDMSLKQATQHLAVHHGFMASERQWERRKEHWNFTKYQKRETRQQYIEQALARGMNMEDILNASDIPVEGSGGDDRAARRNWRRYVKRERSRSRQSHSQPHSPTEGSRRSFDTPGANHQGHHVVEKTYDVNLPDTIMPDQSTGALPDSMILKATSADGLEESPVQFHVVSELNPPPDTNPAPEIFFSTWNDDAGGLQDHGPLAQMSFTNYADMTYQSDTSIIPPANIEPTAVEALDGTYESFPNYQQLPDTTNLAQQTTYNNQGANEWTGEQDTIAYDSGGQQRYQSAGDVVSDSESFPQLGQISQVQFDEPFGSQTPMPSVTPRTRDANDYFQSMTADPLAADLSNMVDMYTYDIQKMVKNFLEELPKMDIRILQKIEEGLQARRDLCLRTLTKEIEFQARIKQQEGENQARSKQRALESITEKCRNLEQIMAEKGINTRAELRDLKARSSRPRQPIENNALDMSQWNAAMSAFTI